ncbi:MULTISPECIES: hypothetical protein [Streptomyces]|uniref:hypothetical protein n=1 Tax=Streptomyces TaxID=1883 RepID=UPI00325179E3|nr:hypothetical protein OG762_29935 [Streptomyces sp. NBC_01136]
MTHVEKLDELVAEFERRRNIGDDRGSAEYSYVIVERLRSEGRLAEARGYAEECLKISQRLPSDTLEAVSVDKLSLGGVPLPEKFHDGVVQMKFAGLLEFR